MSQSVDDILRSASLYSDELPYRILKLPPNAITLAAGLVAEIGEPYSAFIVDKDEVSLMIPDGALQAFSARLREASMSDTVYRLITLEAVLEPDLVGLLARIAQALAAAGIPMLTFAAYSRDHIFVPQDDFDRAILALQTLQEQRA
ncbi:MAG: ACT domain-containing protein [Chloroflexi bacterium]|nr:ACT domain-containing protein [Chloroflexota bacterium]